MEYTLDEIMTKGYACLEKELGIIDMERFLAEVNGQRFNYVEWRHSFFDQMSDEEYRHDLIEFTKTHEYKGKGIEI